MQKQSAMVKPPQIAGTFYPSNAANLSKLVDQLLLAAPFPQMHPKALISPHAGYQYSGKIAARALNSLGERKSEIRRVVLFGPPHRKAVRGMAVPSYDAFATPLGPVSVDRAGIEKLKTLSFVEKDDAPFDNEHCIEVHLPLLQRALQNVEIIPALVGGISPQQAAEALRTVWGGEETLILVSSDLSHFHDYDTATKMDDAAAAAIETLQPKKLGEDQACGRHGVRGLLLEATRRDLRATAIDVRNSGDTAGKKERVVGYGAFVFEPSDEARLPTRAANTLLDVARRVVIKGAQLGQMPKLNVQDMPRLLMAWRPTFVTIKIGDRLRGCYGSFVATQPMIHDVAQSAYAAAFKDARFKPMTMAELSQAELGLSILSVACRLPIKDEADLHRQVRPGIDGLILRDTGHQGLFLPTVWDQLQTPDEFVKGLKRKAKLPEDHWSDTLEIYRFTAEKIDPVPILSKAVARPAAE